MKQHDLKTRTQQATTAKSVRTLPGEETRLLADYLERRFRFRYNTVLGYTEWQPAGAQPHGEWMPVDDRKLNSLTMDARMEGINVWNSDVRRYTASDRVADYRPLESYLQRVHGQWDGTDHIGRLAATVSTACQEWPQWFRTWLLGMVAQWTGRDSRYGHALAPLLISGQGHHKSAFCRQLLPPELQWGYTDSLSMSEQRQVMQAMGQMLLVNLDEFNLIPAKTQEGFLKNVIQLPTVKVRRPYGKRLEEFRRTASFIATTNVTDVLTDVTGCRRFIAVELTAPIDVSQPPQHDQLYAQALAALDDGEPYWLDDAATKRLMAHNRRYQTLTPASMWFNELFVAGSEDDGVSEWLTATGIYEQLRRRAGSALAGSGAMALGRWLAGTSQVPRRRMRLGTQYLVRPKSNLPQVQRHLPHVTN